MTNAKFYGSDLTKAKLEKVTLASTDFSGAIMTELQLKTTDKYILDKPCIINKNIKLITQSMIYTETEEVEATCANWSSTKQDQKKSIFTFWVNLACQDRTEQHAVADKITSRVFNNNFWPERIGVWQGLATSLEQALQKPEECKGLAALPEDSKTKIKAIAKEETKIHQKL
ncbi:pentapeptide repeat-containing protein [Methylocucumis oryzae]|uniref:pentapeptide repeat-containing protein n=1 Tax=Methylocucumis oryzae TaxID=1632867 RepID=UPI001955425B|nr:pentapeptide repeat-containing protein [Methylocucumis oryzae]